MSSASKDMKALSLENGRMDIDEAKAKLATAIVEIQAAGFEVWCYDGDDDAGPRIYVGAAGAVVYVDLHELRP